MKHELYLNNQLLDLDDKFSFTMSYENPILSDIASITSNGTYTIKLPKTTHNLKAFKYGTHLDVTSSNTLYEAGSMDYYRNGLQIIKDGKGIVLSIGDYIEMSIIWGGAEWLKPILDLKLKDLQCKQLSWSGNFMTKGSRFGFLPADFGLGVDIKHAMPGISLTELLNDVKTKGVDLQVPTNVFNELRNLYIPCVSLNADQYTADLFGSSFILTTGPVGINLLNVFFLGYAAGSVQYDGLIKQHETLLGKYDIIVPQDGDYYFDGNIMITVQRESPIPDDVVTRIGLKLMINGVSNFTRWQSVTGTSPYYATINLSKDESIVYQSLKKGDVLNFQIDIDSTFSFDNFYIDSVSAYTSGLAFKAVKFSQVIYPGPFPTNINMPDIYVKDLLKMILWLYGLSAYSEPGSRVLKTVSMKDVYNNSTQAPDWTDKLIEISSWEPHYNSYAQQNWMKYKEDSKVNIKADGFIYVDNHSLEIDKDLLTLPVCPTENKRVTGLGKDMYANIPAYSKDDKEEIKYTTFSPRILTLETNTSGVNRCYFADSQWFKSIIEKYYSDYQATIRKPRYVKAKFNFSDLDTFKLDLKIPIYLKQTGHYYMICKATIQNNTANCELLQMI